MSFFLVFNHLADHLFFLNLSNDRPSVVCPAKTRMILIGSRKLQEPRRFLGPTGEREQNSNLHFWSNWTYRYSHFAVYLCTRNFFPPQSEDKHPFHSSTEPYLNPKQFPSCYRHILCIHPFCAYVPTYISLLALSLFPHTLPTLSFLSPTLCIIHR
jgi:hypothetical protein